MRGCQLIGGEGLVSLDDPLMPPTEVLSITHNEERGRGRSLLGLRLNSARTLHDLLRKLNESESVGRIIEYEKNLQSAYQKKVQPLQFSRHSGQNLKKIRERTYTLRRKTTLICDSVRKKERRRRIGDRGTCSAIKESNGNTRDRKNKYCICFDL